jgi:hypothetical protein
MNKEELERGAASILIVLEAGQIVVRHGTDGDILYDGEWVKEGTWEKLFDAVKKVLSDNKANPQQPLFS